MIIIFDIFYLLINAISVLLYAKAFRIFLEKKYTGRKIEVLAFFLFFIINSTIHLIFRNTIVNIITNTILFLALTLIYNGKATWKIVVSLLLFFSFWAIEAIVTAIFNIVYNDILITGKENIALVALIISRVFIYLIIVILSRYKKTDEIYSDRNIQLVPVVATFIVIVCLAYILPIYSNDPLFVGICSIAVSLVAIFSFSYMEMISKYNGENLAIKVFENQIASYRNEINHINSLYTEINHIKHNIKKELDLIYEKMEKGSLDDAKRYLKETYNLVEASETWITTENVDLNSLLNYKIAVANELNIKIHFSIRLLDDIKVNNHDLIAVVGNLLDNAIEAVSNLDYDRNINVKIAQTNMGLYIKVNNRYTNKIIKKNERFLTTKFPHQAHGYGLAHVKKIVQEYNGELVINCNNDFQVEVLLNNPLKNTK